MEEDLDEAVLCSSVFACVHGGSNRVGGGSGVVAYGSRPALARQVVNFKAKSGGVHHIGVRPLMSLDGGS